MNNKFLPIGSVVLLNGGIKKLMITGFMAVPGDKLNQTYDYCGCLYPEGIITSNNSFLFNNEQIEQIIFKGLVDKEEEVFKEKLNIMVTNKNNNVNNIESADEIIM